MFGNPQSIRGLTVVLVFAVLAALPASASTENIEGSFELERSSNSWKDPIAVRGWAISRCGSPEVVLTIDGHDVARAHPWLEWPGIRERFPGVASAEHPGFETVIDPLHYAHGDHHVSMVAFSPECGATRSLGDKIFVSAAPPRTQQSWAILAVWIAFFGAIAFALRKWGLRYHRVALWWLVPPLLVMVIAAIVTVNGMRPVFQLLANWDGGWYVRIAREGYTLNQSYAFFPLFPLLLRVLSVIPAPLELVASIVNAALFALSLRILQKLLPKQESGLLAYAALPFSFFFVAVYTESLALFLSVAFLLSLRERRPVVAFLCGCLAGLTRITSIALVMFGVDEIRKKRASTAVAAIGPVIGLASHMGFLWATTGDPLRFLHAQEHFGRATTFSAGRLLQALSRFYRTADPWDDIALGTLVLITIAAAFLIIERRVGEGLYCAALASLPLATVSLTSLHRYALLAFPAFPLLAGLLRNRIVYWIVIAIEIYFLFVYARHFGRAHWVG